MGGQTHPPLPSCCQNYVYGNAPQLPVIGMVAFCPFSFWCHHLRHRLLLFIIFSSFLLSKYVCGIVRSRLESTSMQLSFLRCMLCPKMSFQFEHGQICCTIERGSQLLAEARYPGRWMKGRICRAYTKAVESVSLRICLVRTQRLRLLRIIPKDELLNQSWADLRSD